MDLYRLRKIAAGVSDVKSKDIALWREWQKTRSPAALQALINQMNPIIMREVNKWAPSMSRSLLEAEGKRLAVEAFKSYDPKQGTALSTYLASRLPKMSRMVYSNQNVARMSETKAVLFSTYNTAMGELRDHLGREPSHVELADHLGWSPKKLSEFQRQASRKEFVESEEHPDIEEGEDKLQALIDLTYHDLPPLQQKIFDYSTGYRGSEILSGAEMMKKLKLTQGQLSYQKALLVKTIEDLKKRHNV